tara:strand:- start:180 stop:425 length:246 start_codon:yes stop_codon:yes gene_type:complete
MKRLFQIVWSNGKPIEGLEIVGYYDKKEGKDGAKKARFELNRGKKGTQFETEADYWVKGKQIKPYPYNIKRGPDHYRGASK